MNKRLHIAGSTLKTFTCIVACAAASVCADSLRHSNEPACTASKEEEKKIVCRTPSNFYLSQCFSLCPNLCLSPLSGLPFPAASKSSSPSQRSPTKVLRQMTMQHQELWGLAPPMRVMYALPTSLLSLAVSRILPTKCNARSLTPSQRPSFNSSLKITSSVSHLS